jgi:hypothetical protein
MTGCSCGQGVTGGMDCLRSVALLKSRDFQRCASVQWQSVDSGKQLRLMTRWWVYRTLHSRTTLVSDCSPGSQAVSDCLVVRCLVELAGPSIYLTVSPPGRMRRDGRTINNLDQVTSELEATDKTARVWVSSVRYSTESGGT